MAASEDNREVLQARAARNQAAHRRLNDQAASRQHGSVLLSEYVCECGMKTCTSTVALTAEEYVRAHEDPRWFVVAPGHGSPRDEIVVADRGRYLLVEKLGDAARLADAIRRSTDTVN